MTTRTLAFALLMAFTAAAAAPVIARVAQSIPVGPPPPAGLPECRYADEPAARTGYDEWRDTLLDTIFTLGPDYVPPDLVLVDLPGGRVALRDLVLEDLLLMLEAARAEGIEITVTSGYRSFGKQASVFEFVARTKGEGQALRSVARPGHSEHQLGTAIDFKGGSKWLRENAWRFGFVLSYPQGRSPALTCYMPEPWHYRYFGRERAAEIHDSGLSPREWLWEQHGFVRASSFSVGANCQAPVPALSCRWSASTAEDPRRVIARRNQSSSDSSESQSLGRLKQLRRPIRGTWEEGGRVSRHLDH